MSETCGFPCKSIDSEKGHPLCDLDPNHRDDHEGEAFGGRIRWRVDPETGSIHLESV